MHISKDASHIDYHAVGMTRQGRILGVDYGSKRIGIAVSDPLNIIARSVGTFVNDFNVFQTFKLLVEEYNISHVVVGMPYTLQGKKGEKAREVERFVEKLKHTLHIEVVTVDERFTSTIAHQTMLMMGTTRKQRRQKEKVDEMASALILQSYLDQRK